MRNKLGIIQINVPEGNYSTASVDITDIIDKDVKKYFIDLMEKRIKQDDLNIIPSKNLLLRISHDSGTDFAFMGYPSMFGNSDTDRLTINFGSAFINLVYNTETKTITITLKIDS